MKIRLMALLFFTVLAACKTTSGHDGSEVSSGAAVEPKTQAEVTACMNQRGIEAPAYMLYSIPAMSYNGQLVTVNQAGKISYGIDRKILLGFLEAQTKNEKLHKDLAAVLGMPLAKAITAVQESEEKTAQIGAHDSGFPINNNIKTAHTNVVAALNEHVYKTRKWKPEEMDCASPSQALR